MGTTLRPRSDINADNASVVHSQKKSAANYKMAGASQRPPASRLKETVCHGAYRTREYSGLIFAYMGRQEEEPAFPIYASLVWPEGNEIVPTSSDMEVAGRLHL